MFGEWRLSNGEKLYKGTINKERIADSSQTFWRKKRGELITWKKFEAFASNFNELSVYSRGKKDYQDVWILVIFAKKKEDFLLRSWQQKGQKPKKEKFSKK